MTAAAPVHWTTYVQTIMVVLSTIGTFVYVWFTYHIMKWAVGEGQAAIEQARASASVAEAQSKALSDRVHRVARDILFASVSEGVLCTPGDGTRAEVSPLLLQLLDRIDSTMDLPIDDNSRSALFRIRGHLSILQVIGAGSPPLTTEEQEAAIKSSLSSVTTEVFETLIPLASS